MLFATFSVLLRTAVLSSMYLSLTFSLVFCNRFISSCNDLICFYSCLTDVFISLIITFCSDTFLFWFSLKNLYSFSHTTSSSRLGMGSLSLSVGPNMLNCNGFWTFSHSDFTDNRSEYVLGICTETAAFCNNCRTPVLTYVPEIDDCFLPAAAYLSSIFTTVSLPRIPHLLFLWWQGLRPLPTEISSSQSS